MKVIMQVSKPLLETSRNGYLAAISASSYSFVSLLKHFLPIMNTGENYLSLFWNVSCNDQVLLLLKLGLIPKLQVVLQSL